jgi:hypothetical protein
MCESWDAQYLNTIYKKGVLRMQHIYSIVLDLIQNMLFWLVELYLLGTSFSLTFCRCFLVQLLKAHIERLQYGNYLFMVVVLLCRYKSSPQEVAASCDVTFAMLANPENAVRMFHLDFILFALLS